MRGSRLPRRGRRRRAAGLAVVSAAAGTLTACAAWWMALLVPWAMARNERGPAWPLLAVASALAAVVLARLCLAALASTACGAIALLSCARPRSTRVRERCAGVAVAASPLVLRPLVASVLAGVLSCGAAVSASATTSLTSPGTTHGGVSARPVRLQVGDAAGALPDPGWSSTSPRPRPVALPVPTWTPQRPPAARREHVDVAAVVAAPSRGHEPAPVVVRRGDTLWSVAARHLGAGATDSDIAHEWPRWWRANRAAIGADPDLLLPGQVLVPPTVGGGR